MGSREEEHRLLLSSGAAGDAAALDARLVKVEGRLEPGAWSAMPGFRDAPEQPPRADGSDIRLFNVKARQGSPLALTQEVMARIGHNTQAEVGAAGDLKCTIVTCLAALAATSNAGCLPPVDVDPWPYQSSPLALPRLGHTHSQLPDLWQISQLLPLITTCESLT